MYSSMDDCWCMTVSVMHRCKVMEIMVWAWFDKRTLFSHLPRIWRACDQMRCTACDFKVSVFENLMWTKFTDYLFLRNNMPDFSRLKANLTHKPGSYSELCLTLFFTLCFSVCLWQLSIAYVTDFINLNLVKLSSLTYSMLKESTQEEENQTQRNYVNGNFCFIGWRAYACQCKWRNIDQLKDLSEDKELKWVCGRHSWQQVWQQVCSVCRRPIKHSTSFCNQLAYIL